MTYQAMNLLAREKLAAEKIADPENDARELLLFTCGMSATVYALRLGEEVSSEEEKRMAEAVGKRCRHIPLQQIIGFAWFYGRKFTVSENVLIPRFDTETLVAEAKKRMQGKERILDLGCGSGCILCTLLLDHPEAEGEGADISAEALCVAQANADALGVRNASFVLSDVFEKITGCFDLIVSNPPYIESGVIESRDIEVKCHEPYLALNGGSDGLYFYRKIAKEAPGHLNAGGKLLFEIGADQGKKVRKIMEEYGWRNVEIIRDFGGNDRVAVGGV